MNLFKKPKVVFECLIPGVERLMPIVPAKDIRHTWVHKAHQELAQLRKSPTWGMERLIHVAKCPGIFQLQRYGWVMRTWQDITIETFGDGKEFIWSSAIDQKTLANGIAGDAVGAHPDFQFSAFFDNWGTNSLKTLIKMQTPWRCMVPKGFHLMEMPVAYSDENRFTTVSGFFSHNQGPAQMNPQFIWHVLNGKTLIKAGTPIAQYILVPDIKHDMEVKALKEADEHEFFGLISHNRFIKSYGEVKRIYGEEK